jgi:uncharacterized damage-inducible protein DinB
MKKLFKFKNNIMKRLSFLFSILVFTLTIHSAQAQFTQSEMITEWQRAKTYTKAYLDAMPADGYGFKPTPEIRSFAQQMLHLADANYLFASLASGKDNSFGITLPNHNLLEKTISPSKEEVTKTVMASYDWVISTLQDLSPAQMQETIKFRNKDITRSGIYGKGFEHQTHHRGQTTVYLRLKGVTPPGEMLF